jgi:hypothetical protein
MLANDPVEPAVAGCCFAIAISAQRSDLFVAYALDSAASGTFHSAYPETAQKSRCAFCSINSDELQSAEFLQAQAHGKRICTKLFYEFAYTQTIGRFLEKLQDTIFSFM